MSKERLIERVRKQTEGIQTTTAENLIANTFLFPAYISSNLFFGDNLKLSELYDANVLGYKRLVRAFSQHSSTKDLVDFYLGAPCGVTKLCAYQLRKYFGGKK